MGQTLIIALNGLLGNRKKRIDVTELVDEAIDICGTYPKSTVIKGRGGSGIGKFNKILNRIKDAKCDTLILVGKSYGGHWCVRLLEKAAEKGYLYKFKRVGILTVDPSFVLHKMQRKVRPIPKVDYAVNLHQYGHRSGYRLGYPATNIDLPATHGNIDARPEVLKEIVDLLMWADK